MNYLEEIAKQGLGYLLLAGSLLVIFVQNKEIRRLNDQRYSDFTTVINTVLGSINNLTSSVGNLQKATDSNTGTLTNLNNSFIQKFKKL